MDMWKWEKSVTVDQEKSAIKSAAAKIVLCLTVLTAATDPAAIAHVCSIFGVTRAAVQ